MNTSLAVLIVLAMVATLAWLLRSGRLGPLRARGSAIETAISLGERRSLVIVSVEGRRLLLGVTSAQVSLVTELQARAPEQVQA
jgi:flagellar protein FliO/FliZ